MDKIYNLKFGETREIKTTCTNGSRREYDIIYLVTRVPGGWVFKREYQDSTPIFIPFNNEFQLNK